VNGLTRIETFYTMRNQHSTGRLIFQPVSAASELPHSPDASEEVPMRRLLMAGVCAAACTACTQNSPIEPSATAAAGAPGAMRSAQVTVPLNFGAHLTGAEEVPVRDTRAQGQAIFQLSRDGTALSYRLIASNIENVTASHIHVGPAGTNGPVVAFLFGDVPPGGGRTDGVLATGTITEANLVGPLAGQPFSALIDAIQAGNTYVNVHTNDGVPPTNTGPGDFPGGEIRGQIRQNGGRP
jgi:hypothetical protein